MERKAEREREREEEKKRKTAMPILSNAQDQYSTNKSKERSIPYPCLACLALFLTYIEKNKWKRPKMIVMTKGTAMFPWERERERTKAGERENRIQRKKLPPDQKRNLN